MILTEPMLHHFATGVLVQKKGPKFEVDSETTLALLVLTANPQVR